VELEKQLLLLILSGFKYVRQKSVLIDLDPQANLSQSLGLINQEKLFTG
jgi:cellulose biosynthesis protein BcsQ